MGVLHEGNPLLAHAVLLMSHSVFELRFLLGLSLERSTHLGVATLKSIYVGHELVCGVGVLLSVSSVFVVEELA